MFLLFCYTFYNFKRSSINIQQFDVLRILLLLYYIYYWFSTDRSFVQLENIQVLLAKSSKSAKNVSTIYFGPVYSAYF